VHHAIAAFTAELVEDGATLQLGIGAIHNAVAAALRDRSDLGIHSEVISDGLVDLISGRQRKSQDHQPREGRCRLSQRQSEALRVR
jgi:acyl-CoA hydrolase